MVDMFPFPRVTGNTPDEKITEILSYMIQFKESLEFVLMNISTENLSPDLVNKLNSLGAGIVKSNEAREEELAQITIGSTLNVNYETGHLEYAKAE